LTYIIFTLFSLVLILDIKYKIFNTNYNIPLPHPFINVTLKSDLNILLEIVSEVDKLLPQLADFISQFNNTVSQSNVIVITDTEGNMDIDVPVNMSDYEAQNVSNRLGIIDRLITTRGQQINDLFQRGISLENKIKIENPNHVSYLTDKIEEFKKLNDSYKH
jgi:hypothetical protein